MYVCDLKNNQTFIKIPKKYSWLFSRMKIKKNEHYLSLGYYFKSELKDPNKFLPTCNPDDNQTNALSKESIQFRWWTGFYNEKTFEKRQLFLAHLIILWRIKKVSFQKKNQMKNVSNFVFLTSAVQKKWQIVHFFWIWAAYPYDTCRSIKDNVRDFACLTCIWPLMIVQFIVDPLSGVFIIPFPEIKLSYLILSLTPKTQEKLKLVQNAQLS